MLKKTLVLIIVTIIIATVLSIKPLMKIMYKVQYSEHVEKYATEYGIDKYLIYAVIKNESNFKNTAKSNKSAKGLMQIMDDTGEELANKLEVKNELYDEETNILLGVHYLWELKQKYNNYLLALAAYNAGQGNVDSWINENIIKSDGSDIENIPFKETNIYVRKVYRDYRIYVYLYE